MTSGDYKDCRDNGSHKFEIIIGNEDVSLISFCFECSVCGAYTNETREQEIYIKGDLIAEIEFKEEQDELRAIDNDRISAGLK